MTNHFVDPITMQHSLFAELSRMFGSEVPLYDKSLEVNHRCNRFLIEFLAAGFEGFSVSDEQLRATSRERHGAIRIGREDEFRWITRYFACFGMEPHNFYDMTSIGAKSQPVIATAFRSAVDPENRVFSSLLRTDYFDDETARRVEGLLATRNVFSERARTLVERCEAQGGLDEADARALVEEGTERIFKWTGEARDRALYDDLCGAGFKIAADIACFSSHHLNHLTPNTLCIDLYSDAMKWRLGLLDRGEFVDRADRTLAFLDGMVDADWLLLHFRHLGHDEVDAYVRRPVSDHRRAELVSQLADALDIPELDLAALPHNGYKDKTEGPDPGVQILLRQDAYRALTEPIRFVDEDPPFDTAHTARFGEIEQRFYATTPAGRTLYDECLADQTASPETPDPFASFPATLPELLERGLVYATYEPTAEACSGNAGVESTDVMQLMRDGVLRRRGLRYEDFLPFSAAGIFASNLDQYGTESTAQERPTYTREQMEAVIGRPIIDTDQAYRAMQDASLVSAFRSLGAEHLLDTDGNG
ncbi:MAG TPA: hypothetical protein DEO57_06610 [Phycisphaerales bacterium]|mgnify:FL=1|nr:hypothetical protein [Phycisphaerales bacterium]